MIPLTLRSHYSLMWGTASIPALCREVRRLGYDRVALTDTDNLYGLWPFLNACRREGLTPVVGAEITDPGRQRRAVCLVADDAGYAGLCRLISERHLDEGFDLAAALPAHAQGLFVLTSDADLLASWHAGGVQVAAAMPRHPLSPEHALRRCARRLGIPLVATPGSFFLRPEDYACHRLLRAIELNTTMDRLAPGQTAPPDAWTAAPQVYGDRFAACPEAIEHTRVIAERIAFRGPDFGLVMPPWHDPGGHGADAVLRREAFAGARRRYGNDLSEPVVDRLEHELRIIAQMHFSAYFLIVRAIVQRSPRTCGRGSGAASLVAYSLGITNVCPVKHNLYFGRFLNPGRKDPPDIDVDFAWDERDGIIKSVLDQFGSHAAMVSSHILFQPRMAVRETAKVFGLTEAEIGRVTRRLPWFWRIGDGDDALLSDLKALPQARGLDFPPPWPDILSLAQRLIGTPRYLSVHPGGVVITPRPIREYVPVQGSAKGVPIIQWEKDATEEAGLVKIDLLGNRSLGVIRDAIANVHNNGIAFDETRWEPEDDPATQESLALGRTMGCFYIESPATRLLQQKAGVGDFEHLVIHSSIIRPAANEFIQEYVRRLRGGTWDPIHPLLADVLDETYGIMVYQEDVSRAAMALAGFDDAEADGLRKVMSKKDRTQRLHDFRRRFEEGAGRNGVTPAQIDAVWAMMMSFSGYSFCKPHSASYARVSFQAAYLKVHFPAEFMAAVISNQGGFYSTFAYVSEARRLGVAVDPPDVLCSDIRWKGFQPAHKYPPSPGERVGVRGKTTRRKDAPSYKDQWKAPAMDGFWLRGGAAPHPGPLPGGEGEDLVAGEQYLIRNKLSGQRQAAVQVAQKCPLSPGERVGVRGMEQNRMRVGLMAVKGLAGETARRIVAQRGLRPFSTPVDFFQRVRPDEAEARALILCGALDGLAPALSRAQLLWTLAQWQAGRARPLDALPLFAEPAAVAPPELPPDDPQERLRREFRVLGFLCDRHPITLFRNAIKKAGAVPACEVGRRLGRRITFAGWLITGKVVHTKAGDPMEFLTFEDDTGIVETTFFPKAYDRFCHMIDHNRPYLLRGEVEQNWGATTLTVSGVSMIS